VKSLYGLKDNAVSDCDLIVPLGYGLDKLEELPDPSIKTLKAVARIAILQGEVIAFASSNYFWAGSDEYENSLKIKYLLSLGVEKRVVVAKGITNSVTEARNILNSVIKNNIPHRRILVVCDWMHARGARIIWKKIFPGSRILIVSVDGKWDKHHVASLQQSSFRWLLACILRHVALILLGPNMVERIRHPLED